jgi:hypothetical protein
MPLVLFLQPYTLTHTILQCTESKHMHTKTIRCLSSKCLPCILIITCNPMVQFVRDTL